MTVTAAETRVEYAGNGTTTVFTYPYQFFQNDDLVVWLFDDATGSGVHQILGTDYTVTGAMNPSGGTVTTTVAPPGGFTLILINDPDLVQTLHYVNADDFPADSHEHGLDRLTKICQRLSDRIDRAVRAPDYAPEDQVPDAATLVGLVDDAEEAAVAANDSAQAAAELAQAAEEAAAEAAANAQASANNSTDASAAAEIATTKASEAAASAEIAQDAALSAAVNQIIWKDVWSASTTYGVSDAVFYAGSSWIARTDHLNHQPDTSPADWDMLAEKGAPGAPGAGTGDMLRANNLSDVVSTTTSRTNLGLGTSATKNIGTTVGFVPDAADVVLKTGGATGGVMTGHLSLPAAPAPVAENAVRKDYVDTALALKADATAVVAATAAEYRSNSAPTKMLTSGATWSAAAPVALSGSVVAPNFGNGIDFTWDLTVNSTLNNPTSVKPGQKGCIRVQQTGAGGFTISWGTNWKFAGGTKPSLSNTPGSFDVISFWAVTATAIFCSHSADYK